MSQQLHFWTEIANIYKSTPAAGQPIIYCGLDPTYQNLWQLNEGRNLDKYQNEECGKYININSSSTTMENAQHKQVQHLGNENKKQY